MRLVWNCPHQRVPYSRESLGTRGWRLFWCPQARVPFSGSELFLHSKLSEWCVCQAVGYACLHALSQHYWSTYLLPLHSYRSQGRRISLWIGLDSAKLSLLYYQRYSFSLVFWSSLVLAVDSSLPPMLQLILLFPLSPQRPCSLLPLFFTAWLCLYLF